jgi:D-beta-D-heptose 7-phosphate kinase/D-beta-D-heptose 1-phosphate adenosyltransferase
MTATALTGALIMPTRILIIGDLIIDETYDVEVNRISPEAPTPTAELLSAEPRRTPGGAGFAAAWATGHGMEVTLLTAASPANRSLLTRQHGINVINMGMNMKNNVTKTRFIDNVSGYHLLRLDNDRVADCSEFHPIDVIQAIEESRLLTPQSKKGSQIDAVLLSDYRKGFFQPNNGNWGELIDWIDCRVPVLLDTRAADISHWMVGIEGNERILKSYVKLNEREYKATAITLGCDPDNPADLVLNHIPNLLVTRGAQGATLYQDNGEGKVSVEHCEPSISHRTIPDATGCGDIFDISFLTSLTRHGLQPEPALAHAVNLATQFAYTPFEDKIKCLP